MAASTIEPGFIQGSTSGGECRADSIVCEVARTPADAHARTETDIMKMRPILSIFAAMCLVSSNAFADDAPCGTLAAASGSSIALKEGESVNFTQGGKTVHGALHVYKDVQVYRVYWQPEGSSEQYVLANAGENSVRLVATPPRGAKVDAGPGVLPTQQVLSCPAL
jgi:hypothetical protein